MTKQNITQPVVFITGASSGIGAAIAEVYAQKNANLVLAARRKEKLDVVVKVCEGLNPNIKAIAVKCDVNNPKDLSAAVNMAKKTFGRLDVVIANAGFGVSDTFKNLTNDDYRRQFETNIFGVMNTIRAAYDEILKRKGRIAIISSVAGYISSPGFSPYCMSKFAVRALGESLDAEIRRKGASVTIICPGFVDSEIFRIDNDGQYNPKLKNNRPPKWLIMDTDKAAYQIVSAISKRKREKVITGHGKMIVFLKRHFPGPLHWVISVLKIERRVHPE